MSEKVIFYSLVSFSVWVTLKYLSKATDKEPAVNEVGQYLLRMHKLYYIVGIVSVIIGAVFLIAPFFIREWSLFLYVIVFLMLLLFGGLGLLSIFYFKRHYVLFDGDKLEVSNGYGKIKTFTWNELQKVKFNVNSGLLTLTSKTGNKVRVHSHLIGFPKFIQQLENKTEWTAEKLKMPSY